MKFHSKSDLFAYLISFGMLLTLGSPWHEGERSKDLVKRISEDAMKKLASLTDAGRSHWDQTSHFFKEILGMRESQKTVDFLGCYRDFL